jgi:hypothetical protein
MIPIDRIVVKINGIKVRMYERYLVRNCRRGECVQTRLVQRDMKQEPSLPNTKAGIARCDRDRLPKYVPYMTVCKDIYWGRLVAFEYHVGLEIAVRNTPLRHYGSITPA